MSGFICKRCGGPAPMGVGYATGIDRSAYEASLAIDRCECGYSVLPESDDGLSRWVWIDGHGPRLAFRWQAQCRCGWTGADRGSGQGAESDAVEHAAGHGEDVSRQAIGTTPLI